MKPSLPSHLTATEMKTPSLTRIPYVVLIAAALLAATLPASARITRSRSSGTTGTRLPDGTLSLLTPVYSLVFGSGFEFQRDKDQTEYGFPILIEYSLSERLKLTVEPRFGRIVGRRPDVRSVSGFGDLETTLDYEFLSERRYRPALSLEGTIRWPTAADPDLGDPGRDYTLGLIASKDFVFVNIDLNALYTFIGDRELDDTVEVTLASEWRVNHYLGVIAEVASVRRMGSFRDRSVGDRNETEALVGLAWQVSKHLKFEQGIVFKEHGVWEAIFAWEWSFDGE